MASASVWLHRLLTLHALFLDASLSNDLGQFKSHSLRSGQRPLESLLRHAQVLLLLVRVVPGPHIGCYIVLCFAACFSILLVQAVHSTSRPWHQAKAVHYGAILGCRRRLVRYIRGRESPERGGEVRVQTPGTSVNIKHNLE